MILTIAAIIFSIYTVVGVFILTGMKRIPESKAVTNKLPNVSVLITCRNEEEDLPGCLNSLAHLSYPEDKLQIVLIDDNSTDNTAHLLKSFAEKIEHVEFYSADEFPSTHLEAKARGIARAVSKATGEWLFITDADGIIPENWIQHMLDGATNDTGMIVGTTETLSPTLVGKMEKIASVYTIPIGWGFAGWGIPINALGPNMAIRKSVYEKHGGLEGANFRVAEDHAMFNLVNKNGYQTIHHMDEHTKIKLNPVQSFKQIISQQRRWVKGGFEGNLSEKIIIGLMLTFGFFFCSFTLFLMIFYPVYGFSFASIKFIMDFLVYWMYGEKTKISGLLLSSPFSFIYTLLSFIWIPASLIVKSDISWMGDGYRVKYE